MPDVLDFIAVPITGNCRQVVDGRTGKILGYVDILPKHGYAGYANGVCVKNSPTWLGVCQALWEWSHK